MNLSFSQEAGSLRRRVGPVVAFVVAVVVLQLGAADAHSQVLPGEPITDDLETDPRDEMDLGLSAGGGIVQLLHLNVDVLLGRRWAVGLSFGGFPVDAMLNAIMGTDKLESIAAAQGINLHGAPNTRLISFGVNGHFFPFKKFFFAEVAFEMWWLSNEATGGIDGIDELDFVKVTTRAHIWMPMIGLRLGWRFLHEKGFFVEISGGINVLFTTDTAVELSGTTVGQAQVFDQGAQMVEQARTMMGTALREGVDKIAHTIPVYPSATLRLGWAFDIW